MKMSSGILINQSSKEEQGKVINLSANILLQCFEFKQETIFQGGKFWGNCNQRAGSVIRVIRL